MDHLLQSAAPDPRQNSFLILRHLEIQLQTNSGSPLALQAESMSERTGLVTRWGHYVKPLSFLGCRDAEMPVPVLSQEAHSCDHDAGKFQRGNRGPIPIHR